MANATKKPWSYSTGEWGVNRVRAFERQGKGIFLEFRERNPDFLYIDRIVVATDLSGTG